ncbi:MAG: ATP-binding protein [Caldilineaceae bacterium]
MQHDIDGEWSYTEFLSRLLEDEVERRARSNSPCDSGARRPTAPRPWETFDFSFNPSVNRQRVLQLAGCDFIRQHRNLLICGPTGTGKTHLAQALVHEACRQNFDAHFTSVTRMLHAHATRYGVNVDRPYSDARRV